LLPAGAVAGWGLHPLKSAALSRRTPYTDLGGWRRRFGPVICQRLTIRLVDQVDVVGMFLVNA